MQIHSENLLLSRLGDLPVDRHYNHLSRPNPPHKKYWCHKRVYSLVPLPFYISQDMRISKVQVRQWQADDS